MPNSREAVIIAQYRTHIKSLAVYQHLNSEDPFQYPPISRLQVPVSFPRSLSYFHSHLLKLRDTFSKSKAFEMLLER